jgi:hypothetical protein
MLFVLSYGFLSGVIALDQVAIIFGVLICGFNWKLSQEFLNRVKWRFPTCLLAHIAESNPLFRNKPTPARFLFRFLKHAFDQNFPPSLKPAHTIRISVLRFISNLPTTESLPPFNRDIVENYLFRQIVKGAFGLLHPLPYVDRSKFFPGRQEMRLGRLFVEDFLKLFDVLLLRGFYSGFFHLDLSLLLPQDRLARIFSFEFLG